MTDRELCAQISVTNARAIELVRRQQIAIWTLITHVCILSILLFIVAAAYLGVKVGR